jgi:hypothetical protein
MIDAIRKVIAAYHDAPVGECRWCGHLVTGAIQVEGGIHGTPALDDAMEELEAVLRAEGNKVCEPSPA